MNKAAQLAAKLEQGGGDQGLKLIEAQQQKALDFDVIDDVMCIMHSDGSVNMITYAGEGAFMVETISAANVLRVLRHYRPFKDVFTDQMQ